MERTLAPVARARAPMVSKLCVLPLFMGKKDNSFSA
jgi:hypothetical protein